MARVLVEGLHGLGDCIYQRPYIRALCATEDEVWLSTPWPELYADLPVRFAAARSTLRTQALNEAQTTVRMVAANRIRADRRIDVAGRGWPTGVSSLFAPGNEGPGQPYVFDLPDMGPCPVRSTRPLAVIRPVTVRKEWANPARNPDPAAVAWIARELMKTHTVVALASLERGEEWALDPLPPHHINAMQGQLSVREMLALVRDADVTVGGVGWIVPAAIALKAPAFIVLGGRGGFDAPELLVDPRMDARRIGWAMPDNFCRCRQMDHDCPKRISDLPAQWTAWWRTAATSARA